MRLLRAARRRGCSRTPDADVADDDDANDVRPFATLCHIMHSTSPHCLSPSLRDHSVHFLIGRVTDSCHTAQLNALSPFAGGGSSSSAEKEKEEDLPLDSFERNHTCWRRLKHDMRAETKLDINTRTDHPFPIQMQQRHV